MKVSEIITPGHRDGGSIPNKTFLNHLSKKIFGKQLDMLPNCLLLDKYFVDHKFSEKAFGKLNYIKKTFPKLML
jgi:hypothetical protein